MEHVIESRNGTDQLSKREREVALLAAHGHANKVIAYELGLATDTVATHLQRVKAKLGLRTRIELIQLCTRMLALPTRSPASAAMSALTSAEWVVVQGILEGKSNAEIAFERHTSPRTVANQVASIFRKTGAGSRSELAAYYAQQPALEAPQQLAA